MSAISRDFAGPSKLRTSDTDPRMEGDPFKYGEALLAAVLDEQKKHPWLSIVRRLLPGWRKRAFRRAVRRLARARAPGASASSGTFTKTSRAPD